MIHYFDIDDDGQPFACTELAWNMTELDIARRLLELHEEGINHVGPISLFRFDAAMTAKYMSEE